MNPIWLARNVVSAVKECDGLPQAWRRLLWIYADKLPTRWRASERVIGFRYPKPIGAVRLLLRSNNGSDGFIHGEVFGHHYYRLPLAQAPRSVLDLGANSGMTAVYFGRLYPQASLACVEPVPRNVEVLRRNLELNGVEATVFAAAVDSKDGHVRMELGAQDYGHKVASEGGPASETVEVESLSVPTIMRRMGWERISLLKVDIEGHEKTLFAGDCDWLSAVDAMCIECHEGFGEDDLRRLASRYGFLPPTLLPGIWLLSRPGTEC